MDDIHIFAFTHRHLEVDQIGHLHISPDNQKERLIEAKKAFAFDELMYISTCNRVEFIIKEKQRIDENKLKAFLHHLFPAFSTDQLDVFTNNVEHYTGFSSIEHLIKVTSSIDSMIVGEREIITQVRKAFQACKGFGITGDTIRLMIRHTIETAKRIYTETNIAQSPVSVVSLAYYTLKNKNIPLDARILFVGAGVTNTNMGRFLKKHGFTKFAVFNRTKRKAEVLCEQLDGLPYTLHELPAYNKGFDIIITCTGAESAIISPETYSQLLQSEEGEKTVIDLAIPSDLDASIPKDYNVDYISVSNLQKISSKNLENRAKEIISVEKIIDAAVGDFKQMIQERKIELAMREVPERVKAIKNNAIDNVFAKELEGLDESSKETVEKMMTYFEKKYMSVPMKMAKEILLKK